MKKKWLVYAAVAIGAYLVYQNVFAANSNSGGVDFGVLDPNNW